MSFITSPGVIVPPLTAGGVAYGTGSQAKVTNAGTAGQFLQSSGAGVPVFADAGSEVERVARTSNTVLVKANNGNLIDITSGTFSQTFTAAATLGSGWFCYIKNAGTGDITLDPNSTELIDGLSSYVMYPNECRLVQCTGTAFTSVVLSPFVKTITTTQAVIVPPGYTAIDASAWAGGGGGGGGRGAGAGGIRSGAGGAGAGGRNMRVIMGQTAGTSITATIGAGGTGGTGGSSADGDVGTSGGTTSFGTLLLAYGGFRSNGGAQGSTSTGGGGGAASAGSAGSGGGPQPWASSANRFGLDPINNNIGFGGGGDSSSSTLVYNMGCTEYGGSGGGFGSTGSGGGGASIGGASSLFGATGGGGAGGITSGNTASNGSAGGGVGYGSVGGGAAGGSGAAGTAGSVLSSGSGGGGGGGGGNAAGTGYAGGAGAVPGGGGGGGGGGLTTGGAGGDGGAGQLILIGVA